MAPKRCTLAILVTAIAVCLLSTGAWAQSEFTYGVTYFSNAHTAGAPDATLRIVNPGTQGSGFFGKGTLCANIYVFNYDEQPAECCSCRVTPNAELELSVNALTQNPFSVGPIPKRGDIKVVSAFPNPLTNLCDATSTSLALAAGSPTTGSGEIEYGLDGWATHVQRLTAATLTSPGTFAETETGLTHSHADFTTSTDFLAIENAELADLEEDCTIITDFGSGGVGLCGKISGCTQ